MLRALFLNVVVLSRFVDLSVCLNVYLNRCHKIPNISCWFVHRTVKPQLYALYELGINVGGGGGLSRIKVEILKKGSLKQIESLLDNNILVRQFCLAWS